MELKASIKKPTEILDLVRTIKLLTANATNMVVDMLAEGDAYQKLTALHTLYPGSIVADGEGQWYGKEGDRWFVVTDGDHTAISEVDVAKKDGLNLISGGV